MFLVYVHFVCRHGGTDADAKYPDAPDHNAQYDAESHAFFGSVTISHCASPKYQVHTNTYTLRLMNTKQKL